MVNKEPHQVSPAHLSGLQSMHLLGLIQPLTKAPDVCFVNELS